MGMQYQIQTPGPVVRFFLTLLGMGIFAALVFFGFFVFLGLLAAGAVAYVVWRVRNWFRPKQTSYIDAEYTVVEDDEGVRIIEYRSDDHRR